MFSAGISKETRQAVLRSPDGDFQCRGGASDQLVAVLLIVWWWGHRESA